MAGIGTSATWPHYSKANMVPGTQEKKKDNGIMGKDDFLKILIMQLKTQDPMSPMQDRDFIAQMAQFSSVEQMGNVASEMKLLRQSLGSVSSMIGKKVEWGVYDPIQKKVQLKTGVVEAITMRDGEQFAKVGSDLVKLSEITKISNGEEPQP